MKIKILALLTSIIGLIDSIYLIFIKYANNESLCFINAGDCLSVNNSIYSEMFGIPIAGLGAAAYFMIIALILLEKQVTFLTRWSPYLVFGLTFLGFIYSAYLTYLEIAVIKAVCPFCVVSAVAMLALFIISIIRVIFSSNE